MKDYLKKIIAAKEKRAAEIRELIKNSEDVNEVRSLGEELQGVTDEKAEAEAYNYYYRHDCKCYTNTHLYNFVRSKLQGIGCYNLQKHHYQSYPHFQEL